MLFFTRNMTTTVASNISPAQKIESISLTTWAGQDSELSNFRIVNPSSEDITQTVFTVDPNLSISTNKTSGYSQALDYKVAAGQVGTTIYVMLSGRYDATEGEVISHISAGDDSILAVTYFLAAVNEGDTDVPQVDKYAGNDTVTVLSQFDSFGEVVRLRRYDPLPKPSGELVNPFSAQELKNRRPEELCNPFNKSVGYTSEDFRTKAFVGDRDLLSAIAYVQDVAGIDFSDTEKIILPADFEGFEPRIIRDRILFSETSPGQAGYQQTQWTLFRHDNEYSLSNIQKISYFKGQFVFYIADLHLVQYPSAASDYKQTFLPWNQIYSLDGNVLAYVRSYSTDEADEYDPYLGAS